MRRYFMSREYYMRHQLHEKTDLTETLNLEVSLPMWKNLFIVTVNPSKFAVRKEIQFCRKLLLTIQVLQSRMGELWFLCSFMISCVSKSSMDRNTFSLSPCTYIKKNFQLRYIYVYTYQHINNFANIHIPAYIHMHMQYGIRTLNCNSTPSDFV